VRIESDSSYGGRHLHLDLRVAAVAWPPGSTPKGRQGSHGQSVAAEIKGRAEWTNLSSRASHGGILRAGGRQCTARARVSYLSASCKSRLSGRCLREWVLR
jgi:hypothetical protein